MEGLRSVLYDKEMMNVISSHSCNFYLGIQEPPSRARAHNVQNSGNLGPSFPCRGLIFSNVQSLNNGYQLTARKNSPLFASTLGDGLDADNSEDGDGETESSKGEDGEVDNELIRENLERIVGTNDSTFSGIELATLIRKKFGKSYDVQLIKKEFMGRNLLALNVMWKYMEQRSFPLTEEEYLLRLDDVANTLKCWGAVSHIRNSLANLKERPRIGKAVSIFIDMDESGGRSNEWIYK